MCGEALHERERLGPWALRGWEAELNQAGGGRQTASKPIRTTPKEARRPTSPPCLCVGGGLQAGVWAAQAATGAAAGLKGPIEVVNPILITPPLRWGSVSGQAAFLLLYYVIFITRPLQTGVWAAQAATGAAPRHALAGGGRRGQRRGRDRSAGG